MNIPTTRSLAYLLGYRWLLNIGCEVQKKDIAHLLQMLACRGDKIVELARYEVMIYKDFGASITGERSALYPLELLAPFFINTQATIDECWGYLVGYHRCLCGDKLRLKTLTNVELQRSCRLSFQSDGLAYVLHTLVRRYKKEVLALYCDTSCG